MTYESVNVDTLRRQFHSRSVSFNNFQNITEQDIEKIKEKVNRINSYVKANNSYLNGVGLNKYISALKYLTSPKIAMEYKTFDAKILHLILAVDPDLKMYDQFVISDITSLSSIKNAEPEKKAELEAKRAYDIDIFANQIRKELGFYDGQLIKYERILRSTLFKKEGFYEDVTAPSIQPLLNRTAFIKNLDMIDEKQVEILKKSIEKWYIEAKNPQDFNSLAFNLLHKYKEMDIKTIPEQLIYFMLIADPNLNMLKIYEEECTVQRIKSRSNEEVGFFNQGFIKLERMYHDKFEPNMILDSAWEK